MSQLGWRRIRQECDIAGLDIQTWEKQLPGRILNYLLDHLPDAQANYVQNAKFQQELDKLIALVVSCILEHDPLTDPKLRARVYELGDIFREEASGWTSG